MEPEHIDFAAIMRDVEIFATGVKDKIGKNFVLVIGSSKSGKSTILNILAGKDINVTKDQLLYKIDTADGHYAGEINADGFQKMMIGNNADACTTVPNYITVEGLQLWDCPGFMDPRGIEIEIRNAFYIHKILSIATAPGMGGVKFILLQQYGSIRSEGGASCKDSIKMLCKIFQPENDDFKELIAATTFVFNRVPAKLLQYYDKKGEKLIKDILTDLRTKFSVEEIRSKDDQDCAKFINAMITMEESIQYAAIPEAAAVNQKNVKNIVDAVKNGVLKCVTACNALTNVHPKFSVRTKLYKHVLFIHQEYQERIDNHSKLLVDQLKEIFSRDKFSAQKFISKIMNILETDNANLDRGGASYVSTQILQCLRQLNGNNEFNANLSSMQDAVIYIASFGLVLKNIPAGANYGKVIKAILRASRSHIDVSIAATLEKYEEKQSAYIKERNSLRTVDKLLSAPVIGAGWLLALTLGIISGPVIGAEYTVRTLMGDHQDLVTSKPVKALSSALRKHRGNVYGTLDEPALEEGSEPLLLERLNKFESKE